MDSIQVQKLYIQIAANAAQGDRVAAKLKHGRSLSSEGTTKRSAETIHNCTKQIKTGLIPGAKLKVPRLLATSCMDSSQWSGLFVLPRQEDKEAPKHLSLYLLIWDFFGILRQLQI
jgi:hypothetical protein